jgi:outer membrane lipoprotein-sorting protein
MTGMTRLRALRWLAPALVAAAIAVVASGVLNAGANPPLPARTAAQLLVDMQNARVDGLSGTIHQNAKLGLPELPAVGQQAAGSSLTSLLTGSHTLRIWASGPDRQRLALLSSLGESDVVRNGQNVWLWDSSTKSATHYQLPTGTEQPKRAEPVPTGLTPQEAADAALKAIDPTTVVSTDGTASVAGRAAYELVLSPRDARSLIGQVRLALDAQTRIPLRVQVFPRASVDGPAYEVGFTRISYATPGDEQFQFTPPPGTTVKESRLAGTMPDGPGKAPASSDLARTVGTGWTSVAVIPGVTAAGDSGSAGDRRPGNTGDLTALLGRLPRVSGSWGSGRLLSGKLFSALLTDDGRLVVGAVAPDVLYQAAGHR